MQFSASRQRVSFSMPDHSEVSREAIAEIASATGAKDDYHYDAEAATALGYRDVVAPTTFAVIIAQKSEAAYVADPESGIDFSKVVHGSEQFRSEERRVGEECGVVQAIRERTEKAAEGI